MSKEWIYDCISERLGGALFEKESGYKFEFIKQAKKVFLQNNPTIPLIDFGIGEPNDLAPQCAIDTLKTYCSDWQYGGYADNGADFFKASVCEYMQTLFNVNTLNSQNILPILGIKSGLCLLAGTLINPGDLVAYTTPGYGVFATQTKYFGGKLLSLKLSQGNNFLPNLNALNEATKESIKILVLNYPNNPTGAIAPRAFFEEVVQQALKYHWIVIQDAAYSALSFETPISILEIPRANECCVELHSMSKGFNMTGWRLGWLCGNEIIVKACAMYKNNCDSGQFLAIQKAASEALKSANTWLPHLRNKYQRRLNDLSAILKAFGFQPNVSKAGFFLYVNAPKKVISTKTGNCFEFPTAEACCHWLLNTLGIVVVPWDDCGAFLRFSVTFRTENEASFFVMLADRLKGYRFFV